MGKETSFRSCFLGFLFLSQLLQANEISIEVEVGDISRPLQIVEDDQASGHKAVYVDESVSNVMKYDQAKGIVSLEFSIPEDGQYELWGKVFTPGEPRSREDSFFVDLNGEVCVWRIHDWADNWVWRRMTGTRPTDLLVYDLKKGTHTLKIAHRVSGTYLDQIKVVRSDGSHSGTSEEKFFADEVFVYRELTPHFEMPELRVPVFAEQEFNIKDFGAKEGGDFLCSEAIQKAIDTCSKSGGGKVIIPAGEWKSGSIHLRSHVNLHLEKGAVLKFSQNFEHYLPVVFTRWEGIECYNYSPPIYGRDLENIAITGFGLIDGQGDFWWPWKLIQKKTAKRLYEMVIEGVAPADRILGTEEDAMRPNFLQLINCKRILIENVTFKNGPMWTIHPVYCDGMVVRGIKVKTVGPNNDGINPDSSRNILIEDCYFSTGDDCVVLKSGLNEDGWRVGKPTENVIIRRVFGHEGHGGVVIGSEMSGGVKNVHAYDCVFDGTDRGFRMKSMRGRGGKVENIWFEDMQMRNIGGQAIRLNMFYTSSTVKPITEIPAVFENIFIKNIECSGAARAVEIYGLPELAIKNIHLENIKIDSNQGIWIVDGENIELKDIDISTENGVPIYLENVSNSVVENAEIKSSHPHWVDIKGDTSKNLKFRGIRGDQTPEHYVSEGSPKDSYTWE